MLAAIAAVGTASANPILWDIAPTNNASQVAATVADFIAAGVTEDLTGATVANVNGAQIMTSGNITLSLNRGVAVHASGAEYTGEGSALIRDYMYIRDGTQATGTVSGLSLELDPSTAYSFYIWGKGDNVDQYSTLTYDGTPIDISNADPFTTDADNFVAKYTFTTGTTVDDTLEFLWDNNNPSRYRAINGFAIAAVPEPATLGMVAVFGGGMLFIRRRLKK